MEKKKNEKTAKKKKTIKKTIKMKHNCFPMKTK